MRYINLHFTYLLITYLQSVDNCSKGSILWTWSHYGKVAR